MPLPVKRFAYEEAERVLDEYALDPKQSLQFRRAYRKFKHMVYAYAYCDFCPPGEKVSPLALSFAWEDAQIAFVGHGEAALTGAVLQLWVYVEGKAAKKEFRDVVKAAFDAAEEATSRQVVRRYLRGDRTKKPRIDTQGFDLPTYLPLYGVKLEDWLLDRGEDVEAAEAQFAWIEAADRASLPDPEEDKPTLTLVTDNT